MKKNIALALVIAFTMMSTVPAWASYQELTFQKSFSTENGEISIYGTGDMHTFACRCMPSGSLVLQIPEEMMGKKLYFQMIRWGSGETKAVTAADYLQIYERSEEIPLSPEGIFSIDCDSTEKTLGFRPYTAVIGEKGTHYALWLLGGTEYADNAFYGQADKTLTDTMFYFYQAPPAYRKDYETKSHTLEVTAGSNIAVVNGEEMVWSGEVYQNEEGILMVPLRSALASLPKGLCQGILWEEATNTAIVIRLFHTYRFTEGKSVFTKNGERIKGVAKVERKNGVVYIPFETLELFWSKGKVTGDGTGKGKISGTIDVPKEKEGEAI